MKLDNKDEYWFHLFFSFIFKMKLVPFSLLSSCVAFQLLHISAAESENRNDLGSSTQLLEELEMMERERIILSILKEKDCKHFGNSIICGGHEDYKLSSFKSLAGFGKLVHEQETKTKIMMEQQYCAIWKNWLRSKSQYKFFNMLYWPCVHTVFI